jgi:hypothetical protein
MNRFWILDFSTRLRTGSGFLIAFGRKTIFCLSLCAVVLALCLPAQAQSKKIHRVGYLSAGEPASDSARSAAFRQTLHKLG